jgi:hypothetical protein
MYYMLFQIKTSPVVVDVRPWCDKMQREERLLGWFHDAGGILQGRKNLSNSAS